MNKLKSFICIISISCNIATMAYLANKLIHRHLKKKAATITWLQSSRKSLFKLLPTQKNKHQIIFLGASIIQHCEWHELLGFDEAINRGIAGDTTQDILVRINEVIDRNPTQIFIMVGLNDIMKGRSIAYILKNFEAILWTCSIHSPRTQLDVLSILPVAKRIKNSITLNEIIVKVNNRLKILTEKNNYIFTELRKLFVDEDGFLNENLSHDGIHLNGSGYQLIKKRIQSYIIGTVPNDTPKETRMN